MWEADDNDATGPRHRADPTPCEREDRGRGRAKVYRA